MQIEIDLETIDAESATELGYALEKGIGGFVKNNEAAFALNRFRFMSFSSSSLTTYLF